MSLISQSLVNSLFTLAVPGTWMVLCRTFYAESEGGLGLEQREGYIPILSGIKTVSGVQSWSHFKSVWKVSTQRPIYAKRQHQCCDAASDTTVIENHGVTPDLGCNPLRATPLFLIGTASLASLQSCCSVDTGVWCKQALISVPVPVPVTVTVLHHNCSYLDTWRLVLLNPRGSSHRSRTSEDL